MSNDPTPDTFIVIPTYWGRPQERPSQPGDASFDHPTPLDGESTLPHLLDSLTSQEVDFPFRVLILVAAVSRSLEIKASTRVQELLAPYHSSLDSFQLDGLLVASIRKRMEMLGFDPRIASFLNYASIRNLQLLVPAALGARVIIALDDDEVVASDFLHRATEKIGGYKNEEAQVLGVVGAYEDQGGRIYLAETDPSGNWFEDKASLMNQTFRLLESTPDRLTISPIALGGNMVFHRDLFAKVGFDPSITRGEDIDYLINARMAGVPFYYDKQLRITHLPPREYESPAYAKLRQDVIRFIYEREKLRLGGLSPAMFDPYPGQLLRDGLEEHARQALENKATPHLTARFGNPDEVVEEAREYAHNRAPQYFEFAKVWRKIMKAFTTDPDIHRLVVTGD